MLFTSNTKRPQILDGPGTDIATAAALPLTFTPPTSVSVEHVLQFIVDRVERTTEIGLQHELPPELEASLIAAGVKRTIGAHKLNTTLLRIAVLAKAHSLKGSSTRSTTLTCASY